MRKRLIPSGILIAALFATRALADGGSAPPPPTPTSGSEPSTSQATQLTPRQEAEQAYALAFDEVNKGKKDFIAGKEKNAEKKFKRAKERCERAVTLDPKYYEAWNLIGFTTRMLGDYDGAFSAYDRCLAINPDYAPALEYVGEAWLEKGDVAKAREQLAHLEKLEAKEYVATLTKQIEAFEKSPADSTKKRRSFYGGS